MLREPDVSAAYGSAQERAATAHSTWVATLNAPESRGDWNELARAARKTLHTALAATGNRHREAELQRELRELNSYRQRL